MSPLSYHPCRASAQSIPFHFRCKRSRLIAIATPHPWSTGLPGQFGVLSPGTGRRRPISPSRSRSTGALMRASASPRSTASPRGQRRQAACLGHDVGRRALYRLRSRCAIEAPFSRGAAAARAAARRTGGTPPCHAAMGGPLTLRIAPPRRPQACRQPAACPGAG